MANAGGWGRGRALLAVAAGVLAGCDGSDDEVAAAPPPAVAAADPCPAINPQTAPAAPGPYVCAANVGVSDLARAVAFYKGLGMTEKGRLRRTDREEVVLASADGIGSHLVLFRHLDPAGRDYAKNPGKIVFYVKDAAAFGVQFTQAGGTLTSPPTMFQGTLVGFGRDRDNNLVEIAQNARANHSFISAIGIGVSNLEAARTFYVAGLGFSPLVKLTVGKPDGQGGVTPWYDEWILTSPTGKGASVVLMTYTDGSAKNYTDVPVALGLRVPDPAAFAKAVGDAGGTVPAPPGASPEPVLGGTVTGTARDADGTLLHLFKAQP